MPSRDMAALGELPEGSPRVGRQAQESLGYAQSYSLSELLATGRPPNLRRRPGYESDWFSSKSAPGAAEIWQACASTLPTPGTMLREGYSRMLVE